MALTAQEYIARAKAGHSPQPPRCVVCGAELRESVTGCRWTEQGYVDSDCYFDGLSDIVERHPIRTPRIRRGWL